MKQIFIILIILTSFIIGLFFGSSLIQSPIPAKCNPGIYYELIDNIMYKSYLPELDTCSKI